MNLRAFADTMPDLVKLTIVGISIEPPLVGDENVPWFVRTLEYLASIGICIATVEGDQRRYHLTNLGRELCAMVEHDTPCDASLPANDDDPYHPEAA